MAKASVIVILIGLALAHGAGAQTFTKRIQQSKGKNGATVTLHHDQAIDDLVNNPAATAPQPRRQAEPRHKDGTAGSDTADRQPTDERAARTDTLEGGRMIMRGGVKMPGYRVQVYAGGNKQADKQKAQNAGRQLKALFPAEPVYVHFYTPRWTCRMGNYRTSEEAMEMLSEVKRLGFKAATIIRGEIIVQD